MTFGYRVYGLAAIGLGVAGIVWHDFALVWQPVPAWVPERTVLAYIAAALQIAGGLALNVRRTAVIGAAILTFYYAVVVLFMHVPLTIIHPLSNNTWAGIAEQAAAVAGGTLAFVQFAKLAPATADRLARGAWVLFGVCAIIFGIVHFVYPEGTAAAVPKWLPPSQLFWAYATGVAHMAGGIAVLTLRRARLGAILLTAMYLVFQALVHVPNLLHTPTSHFFWVMNAMNLLLVGSAWLVADSLKGAEGGVARHALLA